MIESKLKSDIRQRITDGPHVTPEYTDSGVEFLSVDGIQNSKLVFKGKRFISRKDHELYQQKAKVETGDILLGKAASVGKVAIVGEFTDFSIWSPLALIKPNHDLLNSKFLYYLFQSDVIEQQINDLSTFNTQQNISMGDLHELKYLRPSISQQDSIANFLDDKIKSANLSLSKLKLKLLHLEEYKTALIHNAVTKGLDANGCRILDGTPAADMKWKDSGVEWIGDVPDGWDVEKVKSITSNHDGMRIPLSSENRVEGEYPYHGANSIQGYVKDYIFDGDYLLVGEDGAPFFELGKNVSRIASGKFWVNNHAHILSPLNGYSIKFINEALNSVDYRDYISGSTRDKLTKGQLSVITLPFPSIKEAKIIGDYLISKDDSISLAKSSITQKIALLLEYKKSLINEAVSGEMEV